MGRSGYVFSLDAFVAFSLILISVQILLVMSSSPAGYYRQLLQAQYLAHDTLAVMQVALPTCNATQCPTQTYMELISSYAVSGTCNGKPECKEWIRQLNDENIPPPYSYAFIYEDLDGNKIPLYNASEDNTNPLHYNVTYRRVQASAQAYLLGYSIDLVRGDSPYCNVVCRGFDSANNEYSTPEACTAVPCGDAPENRFRPGEYNVGIIRMLVWG